MALEVGVNLGFVLASPDADPDDDGLPVDGSIFACRHISPAGSHRITELGWWQDDVGNDPANYNMGVYDDDENTPGSLITAQRSGQTTPDSTQGWVKYAGLNIVIAPNTTYWITLGVQAVSGANRTCIAGNPECTGLAYHWVGTVDGILSDPFVSGGSNENISWTIYAKYEAKPFVPQAYMIMKGM